MFNNDEEYTSRNTSACDAVDEICVHVYANDDDSTYTVYPSFKAAGWPVNSIVLDAADDFYSLLFDTAENEAEIEKIVEKVIAAAEDFLAYYAEEIEALAART